jgi:formylglycine-generating enzyme required for sulfatase activity
MFVALIATGAGLIATCSESTAGITYETAVVGDPGNPNDSTGYGAVSYLYEIGKYDVTIGQYTTFLNAVAKTDTYQLYNTFMGTNLNVAGISRGGSAGAYTYSVMDNGGSSANRPITYVSWFDAARFANWMANGQPTGAQGAATTENGAYNLNGAISGNAPAKNVTNPNTGKVPALWIPTENEWYKAAYYQPTAKGGPSDSYWAYATTSDTAPGNVIGSSANQANYQPAAGVRYSVTQSSTYSSSQNYLTDVGAFTGSASFYGTFDQSGLVYQWNDLNGTSGSSRGLRGGNWGRSESLLSSSNRNTVNPSGGHDGIGFRLAAVPEPSTYAMALAGLACGGFSMWRRRKRA